MGADGKMAAALQAAATFVDLVDLRRDRVAVLAFDESARLAQGLTGDRARLQAALAGTSIGEGTRIDLGLDAGVRELGGVRGRPGVRRVVILLTDGRPDAGSEADLDEAVRRARGAGVAVYAIGLGDDVDAVLLRRVAGDAARYLAAPTKADLVRVYRAIAEVLPCG
jgi:Mg-chelatase subunit ChlD